MIPAHKNLKNPPGQIVNPISPAKKLGDIIDRVWKSASEEPPSPNTQEGPKSVHEDVKLAELRGRVVAARKLLLEAVAEYSKYLSEKA